MREILFRGKKRSDGQWVQGDLHQWLEAVYISAENSDGYTKTNWLVDAETVGQFTGLNDQNGAKIFEGDVVSYPDNYYSWQGDVNVTRNIGVVDWDENVMCFYFSNRHFVDMEDFDVENGRMTEVEVVGNVFDHPELLEGGVENG